MRTLQYYNIRIIHTYYTTVAHAWSYEFNKSFDSGSFADSGLQHQTHLFLSSINPKLGPSLLAAGTSSWKLTSAMDGDCEWRSSTSSLFCLF